MNAESPGRPALRRAGYEVEVSETASGYGYAVFCNGAQILTRKGYKSYPAANNLGWQSAAKHFNTGQVGSLKGDTRSVLERKLKDAELVLGDLQEQMEDISAEVQATRLALLILNGSVSAEELSQLMESLEEKV